MLQKVKIFAHKIIFQKSLIARNEHSTRQDQFDLYAQKQLYQRHMQKKPRKRDSLCFLNMGVSCRKKIELQWHATTILTLKSARGCETKSLNVTSPTCQTCKSIRKLTQNNLGAKRIKLFFIPLERISRVGCFVQLSKRELGKPSYPQRK